MISFEQHVLLWIVYCAPSILFQIIYLNTKIIYFGFAPIIYFLIIALVITIKSKGEEE